jgi:hypothetical protein
MNHQARDAADQLGSVARRLIGGTSSTAFANR